VKLCPQYASKELEVAEVKTLTPTFYVLCKECGANGPIGGSEKEAVKLWNGRKLKHANK